MNLNIDKKLLWTSARLTLVCMVVATLLTLLALLTLTNEVGGFDFKLGVGLSIAAVVTMIVGFPVFYVVLFQRRQLEITNKRLNNFIRYDQLSGLLSRATFFNEVELAQQLKAGKKRSDAVFFMDLDHFKKINDLYGHAAGDEVLRQFGTLVSNHLRKGDLAGRLGGEEFAIFIPDCTFEQAEERARSLIKTFGGKPVKFEDIEINCTVSIGVFVEGGDVNLDEMLRHADAMLYKAKESGRNRVVSGGDSRLAA